MERGPWIPSTSAFTRVFDALCAGMIGRRQFITLLGGAAAAWPLAARTQQAGKTWRIGWLTGSSPEATSGLHSAFVQGMRDFGYVEGRDFVMESRFADGNYERFPELAADLVRLNVDVILTGTTSAIRTLQRATTTIPIVLAYSTDPVGNGYVASLAGPGGNITGLSSSADDTSPKQLELVATVVPNVSRIGLLGNPASPNYTGVRKGAQNAAQKVGLSFVPVEARDPQEIENAFVAFGKERVQAFIAAGDAVFFAQRQRIAELALRNRLPSIFSQREYVEAGGLMSYGENLADFYRRAASFVDKIFKGARPADLPIDQPTRFNLVINRKTADALGVAIPPQLYIFADEVME
jgi:putative ABC transport system substrate-binding protein